MRAVSVRRFGFGHWRPAVAGPATGEVAAVTAAAVTAAAPPELAAPGTGLGGLGRLAAVAGAPGVGAEPQTHLEVLVQACAEAGPAAAAAAGPAPVGRAAGPGRGARRACSISCRPAR